MKKRFLFPLTSILTLLFSVMGYSQVKMTVYQFDSLINKNKTIQLIDVRTPAEVAAGHIKGAKNIDFNAPDFVQKISALDKTKPVAVYCAAGGRSGRSAIKLKELGFAQIYDLAGGMTEWKAKQKPVEISPLH